MKGLRLFLALIMVSLLASGAYSQSKEASSNASAWDKLAFNLYPNPAGNSTTVLIEFGDYPTMLDIFILEMNGKIIKEYNYDNVSGSREYKLELGCLTNGIYSVAVQTNESYRVERLIVLK